jgi:hypothetical protein
LVKEPSWSRNPLSQGTRLVKEPGWGKKPRKIAFRAGWARSTRNACNGVKKGALLLVKKWKEERIGIWVTSQFLKKIQTFQKVLSEKAQGVLNYSFYALYDQFH